jgi:Tfp pilus assembly protein PilV
MCIDHVQLNNPAWRKARKQERGMALILVLLTLLLLSAIGLGMMYMSDTETSINSNYRDTQLAFFAVRAGLEEVRDRARTNSTAPLAMPTAMPPTANSILYVTNSAGGADVVDPKNMSNPATYPDDEFCHETFAPWALAATPGVPCTVGPPAAYVMPYTASISPNTGTASALKYKWARITLKQNWSLTQNGAVPSAAVDPVAAAATPICWQTSLKQEIPVTALGAYATCQAAQNAGKDASPVYLVTSLAVTPQGSRRMAQYEMASLTISPPGAALALDGPAANFSPRPSSSTYTINGTDTGSAGYSGPGSCTATAGSTVVPAISTGDAAGVATIDTTITTNPNRSSNYTGSGPAPSVVNQGPTGSGALSGTWSTPSTLDALVSSIANMATSTYTCPIGTPCSPTGGVVGSNSAPQITYVNGDFNYGNASGAGVLVVTGTLTFNGNAAFNGLILVIGQGVITEVGGGSGGFNGSLFVAKTQSACVAGTVPPCAELAALGTPTYNWNGGGTSYIQYNSCWANIGNSLSFKAIAMREEMY